MKKKNLNLKLQLNKETIANLNNGEMNNIKGGNTDAPTSCAATCKIPTVCGATCFGTTCPVDTQCVRSCNSCQVCTGIATCGACTVFTC